MVWTLIKKQSDEIVNAEHEAEGGKEHKIYVEKKTQGAAPLLSYFPLGNPKENQMARGSGAHANVTLLRYKER